MTAQASIQSPEAPTTAAQVLDASATPTSKVNPPAEASNPVASAEEKVSPKLQALIQRERTALEREKAAKARESAAEARAKEIADREAKITEFESLKKTNPLKALELLGLSYQDLTQIALNDGAVTPDVKIQQLEERLNSTLKSQEEEKRLQAEEAKKLEEQKHAQVIEQFDGEINKYLKDNANRYEFIAFEQNESLVRGVIEEHYDRTLTAAQKKAKEDGEDESKCQGELLTIAQAADKVEEHLEKKYQKAKDLNKFKAFLAPKPVLQTLTKPQLTPRQTPKTLNNNLSATPAAPRKFPRTDEERIQAAIAYAKGLRPAA